MEKLEYAMRRIMDTLDAIEILDVPRLIGAWRLSRIGADPTHCYMAALNKALRDREGLEREIEREIAVDKRDPEEDYGGMTYLKNTLSLYRSALAAGFDAGRTGHRPHQNPWHPGVEHDGWDRGNRFFWDAYDIGQRNVI